MKTLKLPWFAVLLLLFLPAPGHSQTNVWPEGWQYRKTLEFSGTDTITQPVRSAVYRFCGPARPDGSDIRIIDENGGPVPMFLVQAGPGNCYQISFPATGKMYLLYNNPAAEKTAAGEYRPTAGLLLEIYPKRGDNPENARKLISDSMAGVPLNRSFWGKIWEGVNPLGPEKNVVKVYTGYFFLPKPQTIGFGTTSAGPSFLAIDEKITASWPGRHGAEPYIRPEHSGAANLEPGLHKLVYYQVSSDGQEIAVAAVKTTADTAYKVIPEDFFLPMLKPEKVVTEKSGRKIVAEFNWENTNYLKREQAELITCRFSDSSYPAGEATEEQWDFGDGQTGSGKAPVHTYLKSGLYPVTLAVRNAKGETDAVTLKVSANQDYAKMTLTPRQLPEYLSEFKNSRLEKYATEQLFILTGLFDSYGLSEETYAGYNILRKRDLPASEKTRLGLLAADLAITAGKYPDAESIYRQILQAEPKPDVVLKFAGLYLEMDRPDDAETLFRQVLSSVDATDKLKKQAQAGVGDAFRLKGDAIKAREAYRRAAATAGSQIKNSAYSQQVLFYLKRKDFSTALEKSDVWAAEIPEVKLDGQWSILRARAFLLKPDQAKALRELDIFRKNCSDPAAPYLGWALYLTAETYQAQGKNQPSRELFQKVIEQFPGSPVGRMAEDKIKGAA